MSNRDLVRASGLSMATVIHLSRKMDWGDTRLRVMTRFAQACGVDLMAPGKTILYLRRRKLSHLKTGGIQQRRYLAELSKLKSSAGAAASQAAPPDPCSPNRPMSP